MLPRLASGLAVVHVTMALAMTAPQLAHAQTHVSSERRSAATGDWRVTPAISVETEYDDNVFLLSPGKRNDLDATGGVATPSRRFTNMQSAGDLVTTMEARFGLAGPGIRGRTLELRGDVHYELYARNAERRHLSLAFVAEQSLRHGRRVRLRGSVTPSYFAKNYLADAVDGDANGDISADERVYEPGVYREVAAELDMRVRIRDATKQHPFGAALQPSIGYYARTYEAPFSGRDISGPTAGLRLLLELSPRASLDLGYELASLSATPARQVMLLDESAFGRDFNGNGTTDDAVARAFELADRSRTEHAIGAHVHYEVTKRADLEVGAEHRRRRFGSGQPFDVANNGRSDSRNSVGAELGIKLAHGVRLVAGGEIASQRINRENDPGSTGEVTDYDKHRTRVGLSYRF